MPKLCWFVWSFYSLWSVSCSVKRKIILEPWINVLLSFWPLLDIEKNYDDHKSWVKIKVGVLCKEIIIKCFPYVRFNPICSGKKLAWEWLLSGLNLETQLWKCDADFGQSISLTCLSVCVCPTLICSYSAIFGLIKEFEVST